MLSNWIYIHLIWLSWSLKLASADYWNVFALDHVPHFWHWSQTSYAEIIKMQDNAFSGHIGMWVLKNRNSVSEKQPWLVYKQDC